MKRVDQWETVAAVAAHWTELQLGKGRKARAYLGAFAIASRVDRLARMARTLHRLYEDGCNGTIGDSEALLDYTKWERVVSRKEARAVALGAELGLVVECQRDPRGASIKMWAGKPDVSKLLGCFS